MFKFNKKKLHYCKNLISVDNSGNIIFDMGDPEEQILSLIHRTMRKNGIYEDKIYVALYEEYRKHYPVYDQVPWLLYYRVMTLLNNIYPDRKLKFIDDCLNPERFKLIPESFRVPNYIKDLINEARDQCLPYVTVDKTILKDENIEPYIEYRWLLEWPDHFYEKLDVQHSIEFVNFWFNLMIHDGGDDSHRQIIRNILDRLIAKAISSLDNQ